jgi:hypothetical protein
MTYEVQDLAYDNRDSALTALVAAYVSADGANTLGEIKAALNDRFDTAHELVNAWGDDIGPGEVPIDADEIAEHIKLRKADIIMASTPRDTDRRGNRG